MTIVSTVDRVDYVGTGTAGPFAYTFRVFAMTDLRVTTRDLNGIETVLTPGTDFTATGVLAFGGGTVTLTTALATDWTLTIRRVRPMTQGTSLRNQGPYFAETIEDALDDSTMRDQTLSNTVLGSIHLAETVDPATFDTALPANMAPGDAVVVNATANGFSMTALSAAQLSAWNAAQNLKLDVFTSAGGDFTPGTTTQLTLSDTPGGVQNITISRRTSGVVVLYETDEYTISGTTLTFTSAIPASTTRVEVRYLYTYQVNTADAANVTFAPSTGPGTDVQTELRAILEALANLPNDIDMLHVKDFGVVGDGVADDTVAFQAALDAGLAQNRVVSGGSCTIRITAGVTGSGPGLVFNRCSFGGVDDPIGILVDGTGFTGLTWGPCNVTAMVVCVWGTGQTANGVYFNHLTFSQVQKIRVFDFDGFGLKIDKLWDCTLLDVSVELCGNATNYAFSMNAAGDTCNMSHIGRLQVEQANQKAIFIESNTLSCVFDNIHSERATPAAGVVTWDLGAARSVFNAGRFHSLSDSANATICFRGENTTFNSMAVEDSIAIVLDGVSLAPITFVAPNFGTASTSIDLADHSGMVQVLGGSLGTFNVSAEADKNLSVECVGTRITALNIGDVGNPSDPKHVMFRDCVITTLASASTNSSATFDHCTILEGGDLLEACTVLTGRTVVTCALTLAGRGTVYVIDSTINANVLMASGSTLIGAGVSRFSGTLGQTTNCSSLLGPGCYATGAVSGLGVPTKQPNVRALMDQVWRKGQTHWNLAPAAGDPPGWVCTTAGGDGTFVFKAMAGLAV